MMVRGVMIKSSWNQAESNASQKVRMDHDASFDYKLVM